jgi:hypothetical protein
LAQPQHLIFRSAKLANLPQASLLRSEEEHTRLAYLNLSGNCATMPSVSMLLEDLIVDFIVCNDISTPQV